MIEPKQISDRRKDAEAVQTAGVKYAPEIQVGLDAEYGNGVGTKMVEALEPMLGHLGFTLDDFAGSMIRLTDERDGQVPLRKTRDDLGDAQYADVMQLRNFAQNTWGDGVVQYLRLDGRIPNNPNGIYETVEWLLRRAETIELPEGLYGATVDIEVALAPIRERHAKMGEVKAQLAGETREEEVALSAKNASMVRYDQTFQTVASILSSLLEAIGKDDLAGRVRPSRTNPGRASGPLDDVQPEPGADADPAPATDAEDAQG